jgi:hypothetical protein
MVQPYPHRSRLTRLFAYRVGSPQTHPPGQTSASATSSSKRPSSLSRWLLRLSFVSELFGHPWQRHGSSHHQKQSSHSSLGLCSIIVQVSRVRSVSTVAPPTRHTVFHEVYQLADIFGKIGNLRGYKVYAVSAVIWQSTKFGESAKLRLPSHRSAGWTVGARQQRPSVSRRERLRRGGAGSRI